jgi:cob(I)alamin adenosyltransferase
MKIYTGSGDKGKTGLFSGERVSKSHPRIDVCGDIDELNSFLGALIAAMPESKSDLMEEIRRIQTYLLHIGAWFSTTPGSPIQTEVETISDTDIAFIEHAIDRMDKSLPELRDFILPGGLMSAALAHVARAVTRRVERHMVRLISETVFREAQDANSNALVFINRLSDYLFQLARFLNRSLNVSETPWKK